MKTLENILLGAAVVMATALPVSAQTLYTGGLATDRDVLMPADMVALSQTNFNLSTAHSMAMAGAFTSLGADLASMSINPAGLGMYRDSEVSITPLVTITKASNSAPSWESNSRSRFALGNIGGVFNIYEGTGRLLSLNLGVGYNRMADLNYNSSFASTGNVGSIADMYSKKLGYAGIKATDIMGDNLRWGNYNPGIWGAILGYKGGLTDDPTDTADWSPTWISSDRENIDIGHYSALQSRGSVGEFAISIGGNIDNKLYFGATLGIQSLYQKIHYHYAEDYTYPAANPDNPGITEGMAPDLKFQMLWARMNQAQEIDGAGVNFKLGVTWRPVPALRIGAAFHTPTYYSLTYRYQANIYGLAYSNDPTYNPGPNEYPRPDKDGYIDMPAESPVVEEENWAFTTPARMMVGVSWQFGRLGMISVDYERAWYNGMRAKDVPSYAYSPDLYKQTFRNNFEGSNTVRIGLELKPVQRIALRGGFGYSGSWLKDNVAMASPTAKSVVFCGAGAGFSLSRSVTLDIAYGYQKTEQTGYELYYADEVFDNGDVLTDSSASYSTDYKRHNIAVTLGFRF